MKRIILQITVVVVAVIAITCTTQAQVGHSIEITITDLPDTTYILAYYYNESTYTKDTAYSDNTGKIVFNGTETLPHGVYILVLESTKSKLFDFAIYDDQHFALTTNSKDYYKNMKVEGDLNNKLFFENLVFNGMQNEKAAPFTAKLNDANSTEADKASAQAKLKEINDEVDNFQDRVINEKTENIVSKILKARRPIIFPDDMPSEGEKASQLRYQYYKSNFWKDIDFSDDALLRLPFPMIMNKMDEYFDRVVYQQADSIIKEIEFVVGKTKENTEMYKFVVWSLTSKYYAPEVMGLDQVFVHLSDTYFETGEMDFWANQQLKDNVRDRSDKLRLSMIGMPAPNLIMQDQTLKSRSMHDITNKYTILYFYDPDCGHCKEETPKLVSFSKSTKFDVQVYSICADTSMVKMKGYIKEMNMNEWVNVNGPRSYVGQYQELYDAFQTPTLYILDEKKKIIAKKLPADRLEDFFSNQEKIEKAALNK